MSRDFDNTYLRARMDAIERRLDTLEQLAKEVSQLRAAVDQLGAIEARPIREFDSVTLRVPVEHHPAGTRCTIVDLDRAAAFVEFDDDPMPIAVRTADLAPIPAGSDGGAG